MYLTFKLYRFYIPHAPYTHLRLLIYRYRRNHKLRWSYKRPSHPFSPRAPTLSAPALTSRAPTLRELCAHLHVRSWQEHPLFLRWLFFSVTVSMVTHNASGIRSCRDVATWAGGGVVLLLRVNPLYRFIDPCGPKGAPGRYMCTRVE